MIVSFQSDDPIHKQLDTLEGRVDYDMVDVDEGDLSSFNGAEVLEVEDE